jgi:LacI family transcriptional regulator
VSAVFDHEAETIDMIKGYLQGSNRLQAIVAINDLHALLTVEAAHCAMLNVPDDLAVVGFDDLDFASALMPPLTTIPQQPSLWETRQRNSSYPGSVGMPSPLKRRRVPTQLIVRGSSQRSGR